MSDYAEHPELAFPKASDTSDKRDEPTDSDAAFAARIAGPLRRAEHLAPDFEPRLFAAVSAGEPRVKGAARQPTWWRRPHAVRVSPIVGLAMAAGFAGLVSLATLRAVDRPGASAETAIRRPAATVDTVHLVRFVLVEPGARRVALVGDFNGWAADATPLAPTSAGGVWTVSVPLTPGRHEYAFVVDGARWITDPAAPRTLDDFDTQSSVVTIEPPARSS
jgi:hypothetical protein